MIGIDTEWLDVEEGIELAKKYLELSLKETIACDNVVRTGHTTLEAFEDNIRFLLTGESKGKGGANAYTKDRIRNRIR